MPVYLAGMAANNPTQKPARPAAVNVPKKPTAGPIEQYVRGKTQSTPQMSGLNFGGRDCCK